MLGRIVLVFIQFAIAWRLAPELKRFMPPTGDLEIFVLAVCFGLMVWLIGVLGHLVLKDVAQPTPTTLLFAIVFALIFAGLTLVPDIKQAIGRVVQINTTLYPLIGAVIGYAVKR